MKNILFISPTGTLDNGAEISIANLMGYLSEEGFRVFNAFPKNGHPTYPEYLSRMQQYNIKCYPLDTLNWWWEEAPGMLQGDDEKRSVFYLYNIKKIRQIIVEQKIDIVITNTVNVFQGAVAAASEKIPHLWLIHENPVEEFEYYNDKFKFISEQSVQVFAASKKLSEYLNLEYAPLTPVKFFIPYSEVSRASLKSSNIRRIISIGKINNNKNQMELLRAYYQLNRLEIPLIFIGGWEDETKHEMDDFIKTHGLTSVQFLGNQSYPWLHVTDADICVLTSKMEVFGLALVETILNGVPAIVSDNPGYCSVSDFFELSSYYSLGNIEELTHKMGKLLDNFTNEKEKAMQLSNNARAKYQLKEVYQPIIDRLNSPMAACSDLEAISNLFGNSVTEELIYKISREQITIYYETEVETFNQRSSLTFGLPLNGKFTFRVPEGSLRLRIDLGENVGIYNNIKLVALESGTELIPQWTNGLIHQGNYVFLETDPQLIYEVRNWDNQEFFFQYHRLDINGYANDEADEEHLFDINEQIKMRFQRFEQLTREKSELENALKDMTTRYHSVIGSKRWIIPTKIINVFRRKK